MSLRGRARHSVRAVSVATRRRARSDAPYRIPHFVISSYFKDTIEANYVAQMAGLLQSRDETRVVFNCYGLAATGIAVFKFTKSNTAVA